MRNRFRKTTGRFLILAALSVSLLLLLSACGQSGNENEETTAVTEQTTQEEQVTTEATEETEAVSDTLVVYFSHTGNTKAVAEELHELVGGDLIEIEPVDAYPEGYDAALDPAKQEQRENARPKIKGASITSIPMKSSIWAIPSGGARHR